LLHGAYEAGAIGLGRGHVIGIVGKPVAHHFSQNARPARLGVFELFQHHDACALAEGDAVAILVERLAYGFGQG